jgi:ATP-dependent helicase Lhr and Lhr-like helicase
MAKTTMLGAMPLLHQFADIPALGPIDVAAFVGNIKLGKYAAFIPDVLARRQWAQQNAALIGEIPDIASGLLP